MALTQYVTATTLDGCIADADNSLDWLFAVERVDEGAGFAAFLDDVGAMAMGATTYQWVLDHEQLLEHPERWQATYADRPCWVFGHRELEPIPGVDLRFVQGDVAPVHAEMVEAAGGPQRLARRRWRAGRPVPRRRPARPGAGQHRAGDARCGRARCSRAASRGCG